MSFGEILNTLLFKPLELIFEIIYMTANRVTNNPGLSIIALSIIMNFLVLPLYMRADAMQQEQRDTEQRLSKVVTHIKKTFKGNERMMMLQTYYRQNNYSPIRVVLGAVSLLLQIPFFIAAYNFLSNLEMLHGVSLGAIKDLGKPDAMLSVAGVSVNILPFVMTAINLISCLIFTKGSSFKSKIQLYAMALFFLVFLYSSPSGLVFYWTLNNAFSLVKTVFYKLKNPLRVLTLLSSGAGIATLIYGLFFYSVPTLKKTVFFVSLSVLLQTPLVYNILMKTDFIPKRLEEASPVPSRKSFIAAGEFLSVLTGVLIPSSVIAASPQEFTDFTYFLNPLWFIVSSFCLSLGIFVIYMGVFYWLAKPAFKAVIEQTLWIACGVAVADYMFFGKNLGNLSPTLKYDGGLNFTLKQQLINTAIIAVAAAVFYLISVYLKKHISQVLAVGCAAILCMSGINAFNINKSINEVKNTAESYTDGMPHFSLSKNGKNVVVIMLDRAMGIYVPYMFAEKPELKDKFSGFTYYSNVISFGTATNFATPALFGGYEYTPVEMNKRNNEPLVKKHNEALLVMPVLFDKNNYDVTVLQPPYANYKWIPDLSIYKEYPQIKAYLTDGKFSDDKDKQRNIQNNKRNFFVYGVLKSVPLVFQETLYDLGGYNQSDKPKNKKVISGQKRLSNYTSEGLDPIFMGKYNVLKNLSAMTAVKENGANTFLCMTNDTTHEPMMLQEPDYIPSQKVDNTEYENKNSGRFDLNGKKINMNNEIQIIHYQANMAAMLTLGDWFDYLRENGVYDNTRIILVSDHGKHLAQSRELWIWEGMDGNLYYPLLMVKDFDASGFTTSDEFMTNADVPFLAANKIIENPVNPFTEKALSVEEKMTHEQYMLFSDKYQVEQNNGNTFLPGDWISVRDNIWDKNNWKIVARNSDKP